MNCYICNPKRKISLFEFQENSSLNRDLAPKIRGKIYKERCLSGRKEQFAKLSYQQWYRGFESLSLLKEFNSLNKDKLIWNFK